jgi:voltage-gated potassium channel
MASLVTKPEVIEFLDQINGVSGLQLEEYSYEDFKPEYREKTIRELALRNTCGVTIIGYKSRQKGYLFNPNSETVIQPGDIVIILGTVESLEKLNTYFISSCM